ncbi:hypothetical protein SFC66_11500 [Terribacillus saccharophilus]|uniref:hypothetical protein n=1 Tax=Terribacillus saccharophilus TaxID=361277 RepID=UPI0039828EBA
MSNEKRTASPSEMDQKYLPDVPAFQDEFTRDYLQSTEPVREGFYPFEAKSEKFTMDFPEDMTIDERSYSKSSKDDSEFITISHTDQSLDVITNIQLKYYGFMGDEETSKQGMSKKMRDELNFENVSSEYENQKIEVANYSSGPFPGFATLIWNDNDENIQIFADITCGEDVDTDKCSKLVESEKERILGVFQSIKLTQNEGE